MNYILFVNTNYTLQELRKYLEVLLPINCLPIFDVVLKC